MWVRAGALRLREAHGRVALCVLPQAGSRSGPVPFPRIPLLSQAGMEQGRRRANLGEVSRSCVCRALRKSVGNAYFETSVHGFVSYLHPNKLRYCSCRAGRQCQGCLASAGKSNGNSGLVTEGEVSCLPRCSESRLRKTFRNSGVELPVSHPGRSPTAVCRNPLRCQAPGPPGGAPVPRSPLPRLRPYVPLQHGVSP